MPQGVEADVHLEVFPAALLQLPQRDIDLFGEPAAQPPVVLLQAAAAVTANLFRLALATALVLLPEALHTAAADPETLAHFADTFTFFPRSNDTQTQILTQWSHEFFLIPETVTKFSIRLSKSKML
jgi:hypothetical protein